MPNIDTEAGSTDTENERGEDNEDIFENDDSGEDKNEEDNNDVDEGSSQSRARNLRRRGNLFDRDLQQINALASMLGEKPVSPNAGKSINYPPPIDKQF